MTTPHSDAAPELSLQSSSIRGGGNIISPTISGHGRLFNVTVGTMNNPMLGDSFSAPLPVVSVRNCPLPTETFQGRQDILLDMQAYFEQKVHSQKIYLLYGLGGIGKTQIALKFVSDVGTKFTDTWFVNASSQQTIEADYKQIMINKNLANEPALQWLESSFENWLVLLDNANDISLNLHELLPNCRHGNVVITSRNPELQAHTLVTGLSKEIHQLDDPDAIKLLLVMSGIKDASGYQQDIALQIVQITGGAEVLELQVLEKRTEILGPDHPNTLNTMSNLAETKGNLGDYRAAEQLMTQVLHKYTDLFGEDHPKTVGAKELLDSLATVEESNERSASPEEHGCLPACCAIC
ncbi:NB-ARC-domain-containing protein [Mycena kentingensis (nom. inval.)]|nr:NB-ARC-domain-containing protein [Mycena kentingensis (nom. inval.)]